jgi:hypothetical protein
LASLEERLKIAQQIASSDPLRAATMYRAIIDLHQQHRWAADIVADARRRLDLISKQE